MGTVAAILCAEPQHPGVIGSGTPAMGVCRRGKRPGSTLTTMRKTGDLLPKRRVRGQQMENY